MLSTVPYFKMDSESFTYVNVGGRNKSRRKSKKRKSTRRNKNSKH